MSDCGWVKNGGKCVLEKENKELKEQILLLKASESMLEFAKQTYKDNWNKLKEWLEETQINKVDIDEWTIIQVRDKMQEIEGGMNV